ncbi:hypothetical protein CXG81DRAFT_28237 [Caulochytrium protostelioides]|uniref:Nicastrin n=1 Tax=Caulochytrium protostelioides TaxID=1555241 RepID=A0A4P9X2N3_9FUNG|nr:hypothetical protein CXG81DRAFT_28237 [Caulochytrium protostelioides]|eukprot:RKO98980.1 hypothetical protein CXG81DRAFT_28237 [Caulochytrium protostelioides]
MSAATAPRRRRRTLCSLVFLAVLLTMLLGRTWPPYAAAQTAVFDQISYQRLFGQAWTLHLDADGTHGVRRSNAYGVLYNASSQARLDAMLGGAVSGGYGNKWFPVMSYALFSRNVDRLMGDDHVSGMLIIAETTGPDGGFSLASRCPQCEYGLYAGTPAARHPWNPQGTGLLHRTFVKPVFGFTARRSAWWAQDLAKLSRATAWNEAAIAAQGGRRHGLGAMYYAVQADASMWAAHDAVGCLHRGRCDPIGGLSVWASLDASIQRDDGRGLVMLVTRIDSSALVRDFAIGAGSARTGMIAAMAAVHALNTLMPQLTATKHVVVAFFNGEAWGLAGSRRFVQDVSPTDFVCHEKSAEGTRDCPVDGAACTLPCFAHLDFRRLPFERLDAVIEVASVGHLYAPAPATNGSAAEPLAFRNYVHIDTNATADGAVALRRRLTAQAAAVATVPPAADGAVAAAASTVALSLVPATGVGTGPSEDGAASPPPTYPLGLPPTSALQAFLERNRRLAAVMITDYDTTFSNPYFGTEMDDGRGWGAVQVASLCATATQVARAVAQLTDMTPPSGSAAPLAADCALVAELARCFLGNITCELSRGVFPNVTAADLREPTSYSQTFHYDRPDTIPFMLQRFLLNMTSPLPPTPRSCQADSDCAGLAGNGSGANGTDAGATAVCISGVCRGGGVAMYHYAYGTGIAWDRGSHRWKVVATRPDETTLPDANPLSRIGTSAESKWDNTRLRLFTIPSFTYRILQVVLGLTLTIGAAAATLFLQRHLAARRAKDA